MTELKDYAKNDFTTKPENEGSIFKKGTETPDAFTCDEELPTIELSTKQALAYRIIDAVTFGFFRYVDVTITMSDGYSGLQKFEHISLKIEDSKGNSEEKELVPAHLDSDTYTFTIDSEYKDSLKATVWDNSGNVSSTEEIVDATNEDYNGVIVDTTDPVFTETAYEGSVRTHNDKHYYDGDATVKFTVDEEYFFRNYYKSLADLKAKTNIVDALKEDVVLSIKKNVEPVDVKEDYKPYYEGSALPDEATNLFSAHWDEVAKTISITIPKKLNDSVNDGDYTVTLTYTDLTGHSASVSTEIMVIDTTPAVFTAHYNTPVQVVKDDNGNEVDYYNEANPIGLSLCVEERNFNAEDFVSGIKVFDFLEIHNETAETAFVNYLKNDANWTHEGNEHTIAIALEEYEANFIVDYSYADMAGNQTEETAKNVTYDKTAPEVLELSVNNTVVRKVLNSITFGIFNTAVDAEVTITARDTVAGIDTITYSSYDVDGAIGSVAETTVQVENKFVPDAKEEGLKPDEIYTFTVAPEFRNGLTATAVDYSENSTTVDKIKDYTEEGINPYEGIIKDKQEGSIAITVDDTKDYASKDTFPGNFNFHVKVNDGNSGIGNIEVTLNNHPIYFDAKGNNISDYYSGENLIEDRSFEISSAQIGEVDKDDDAYKDGKYTLKVTLTDNAGNVSSASYTAYIDVFAPMVSNFSFKTNGKAYVGDEEYENGDKAAVVDKDTKYYDYYFEKDTLVTVYVCDYEPEFNKHTCGVSDIVLNAYNTAGKAVTCKPVENSFVQNASGVGYSTKTFLITGPFKGSLYAIATDHAGNTPTGKQSKGWVSSAYYDYLSAQYDGYVNPYDTVLEDMAMHKKTSSIEFALPKPISTENDKYNKSVPGAGDLEPKEKRDYDVNQKVPLYNKNVPVTLTVTDTYSGIKEIAWSIVGQPNQDSAHNDSGVVTVDNDGVLSGDDGWSKKSDSNLVTRMQKEITVKNDSNDIVILVELTDRAGNTTHDYYIVGVDKTGPQVKISYNNNSASEEKYFKDTRTATVEVIDRNFDAGLMNVMKNGSRLSDLSWSKTKLSDGNYRCTANVPFDRDGDYTFKVSGKDRAQNSAKVAFAAGTVAGSEFTVDLTDPVVTVSYQSAATPRNGNYYNKTRTATIQVVEHNWNPQKFIFTLQMNDGSAQQTQLSWSNSGDTHTATFAADSVKGDKYTLDFTCKDRANRDAIFVQNGARVRDYTPESFYVDQQNPTITYTFNGKDTGEQMDATTNKEFSSGVQMQDTYYDSVSINIFGKVHNYNKDISSAGTTVDIDEIIEQISKDNKQKDDFYTVTITAMDKAGNTSKIVRYFAINRNGSIFILGDSAAKLVDQKYTNNPNDYACITIQERNVDPIKISKSVLQLSVDGKLGTLKSGDDYTVAGGSTRENNGYYTVIYAINAPVFDNDALYKLLITSHDAAGNTSKNSNKKGMAPDADKLPIFTFIHDETAPTIEINLDESKKDGWYSIAAGEYTVTFKPIDTGSGINYDSVNLTIGKGDDAQVIMLGDEQYQFNFDKETGEYSFVLKGNYSDVTFNYEDNAGNAFEQLVFKHITVSSNALARFFYNTPLFVGTLAGIVAVAAVVIILVARRKKKAAAAAEQGAEN
ncbi:MAG: hypothetical protein IKE65_06120, partial [Clostridia bacterium]|nr:hypothetical protein [Clostridia bacterium]